MERRRRSDRVMTIVMVLEEEVLRSICVYGPQSGQSWARVVRGVRGENWCAPGIRALCNRG